MIVLPQKLRLSKQIVEYNLYQIIHILLILLLRMRNGYYEKIKLIFYFVECI